MRHGRALMLGLLTGLVAGCASGPSLRPPSWLERFRSAQRPPDSEFIQFDVALLERPLGDPTIDHDLWDSADEQTIPLERKLALEENGFRVGHLGGLTPAGFQALLTSDRSCVNPRRLFLRPGNATSITLGPVIPSCRFQMLQGDQAVPLSLEQAECTLTVVSSLTDDGRMHLRFTPEIRHGAKATVPRPAEDGSGFMMQEERPAKTYAALSWEVTLAPNQYLVVGTRSDRPESLGYQCFLRRDGAGPMQRLLVVRCCRGVSDALPELAGQSTDDDLPAGRPLPLALQAAWTTPRTGQP
jgi:hypothetical protein